MVSIFNQPELSLIRARVRSGVANAKAKGKQIGRKPTTKDDIPAVFYKHLPAFQAGHMNASELARICDTTLRLKQRKMWSGFFILVKKDLAGLPATRS